MTEAGERKLIVAFVERGLAHQVAEALRGELGLTGFHFHHARGAGALHEIAARDVVELDILGVAVEADRADDVFAFVFERARIDRPGGGLMFQAPLAAAMALGPPLPQAGEDELRET